MEISKKFNIQLPHNILMSYLKNFCYTEKVNDFSVFLIQYSEIIESLVRENFDELSTALFYYFKPISLCVLADILNDNLLFNKINTTTANDCLIYFEEGGKNNRQGDYNPKKMKKIFIQNKPIIINLLKNQKLRRNLNHDLFERDTCKVVKI